MCAFFDIDLCLDKSFVWTSKCLLEVADKVSVIPGIRYCYLLVIEFNSSAKFNTLVSFSSQIVSVRKGQVVNRINKELKAVLSIA